MSSLKVLKTTEEAITYQITVESRAMFDGFLLIEKLRDSFYSYADALGIEHPTGKKDLEEALTMQGLYLMMTADKPEIKKTTEGYHFQEMAAGYIRSLQALKALGFLELFYQTSQSKGKEEKRKEEKRKEE